MPIAYSALADGTPRAMLFMFLIALQVWPAGSGPPRSSHANPRWGVVQLVGHLTVNEDGEGSNPSAPANFPCRIAAKSASDGLIPLLIPISFAQKTDVSQPRSIYGGETSPWA